MEDLYKRLYIKIGRYRTKYGAHFRHAALRFAFWTLRQAFTRVRSEISLDRDVLNIGFYFSGGLGDYLISANYLSKFKCFLGDSRYRIYIFATPQPKLAQAAFVDPIDERPFDVRRFDLFISAIRFPQIETYDRLRVERFCPRLLELIDAYRRFEETHRFVFALQPLGDSVSNLLSILTRKTRIQQPDVGNFLKIGPEFDFELPAPSDEEAVLRKFGLSGRFVTVNRGVDAASKSPESTKMWPLEYFARLCVGLKAARPNLTIVQLGASPERSPQIAGVDVNLVGKTTLDDVKILLKRAALHVDGEGGMVHLRRAVKGGKSVVLFGPTEPELYGYSQNLNLRVPFCRACEWASSDWTTVCARTGGAAECMRRLIPEFVLEKILELDELR